MHLSKGSAGESPGSKIMVTRLKAVTLLMELVKSHQELSITTITLKNQNLTMTYEIRTTNPRERKESQT